MVQSWIGRAARHTGLSNTGVPHVLLASGDAGCPSLCHPRTGGTRGPLDDATVHPPESPAIEGAIRLLDDTKPDPVGGEIAEAEGRGSGSTVERTS